MKKNKKPQPPTENTSPIREVLSVLCGGKEPPAFVQGFDLSGYTDAQVQELQDWCSMNCVPKWSTGIGTMEAAESLVNEALSNGNIRREM